MDSQLENKLVKQLNQRRKKSTFRQLTYAPPNSADLSSNDFLSLSSSAVLKSAFFKELEDKKASFVLGSGGSRLLDGNSEYATELESRIAEYHNGPAGLLWGSGFDANSGVFACIPRSGDIILYDELIHASVHDGMKLSRASVKLPFKHNSVEHLESLVLDMLQQDELVRQAEKNIFVALESVYSMDGDVAPLAKIVSLKHKLTPKGNMHIIIDEAHATGVLGPGGRGLVCQLGLEKDVFGRLHTFGKSLACSGAILLCSPIVRSYLINYARPLIYTTFLPYPLLVAIKASYSLLRSGYIQELVEELQRLITHLHSLLLNLVSKHRRHSIEIDQLFHVADTCPSTPIFSLETQHARSLAKYCQDRGYIVRAVVPPTVPTRRVRVCLHAANTFEQLQGFTGVVDQWIESMLRTQHGSSETTEGQKPRL